MCSSCGKALKDGRFDCKYWTWNMADKIGGKSLKKPQSSKMVLTGFSKGKDSRNSGHSHMYVVNKV